MNADEMCAARIASYYGSKGKKAVNSLPSVRAMLSRAFVELSRQVAAIGDGAEMYMKGGSAYAILMQNAEAVGIRGIPDEEKQIASDWDCGIQFDENREYAEAQYARVTPAIPGIIQNVWRDVIQPAVTAGVEREVREALAAIPACTEADLELELDHPMQYKREIERSIRNAWLRLRAQPTRGDDINYAYSAIIGGAAGTQSYHGFYYFNQAPPERPADLSNWRKDWPDYFLYGLGLAGTKGEKGGQIPLIDIAVFQPMKRPWQSQGDVYGRGVPVLPPSPNEHLTQPHNLIQLPAYGNVITVVGYDEMWLDLFDMVWIQPNAPKRATRKRRFANILARIFCSPQLFVLFATPIKNHKLVEQLLKAPNDNDTLPFCQEPKYFVDENGMPALAELDETLDKIIRECHRDTVELFGQVIVDAAKECFIPGSDVSAHHILGGWQSIHTDRKCEIVKRMYMAQVSWRTNKTFMNYIIACIAYGLYDVDVSAARDIQVGYIDRDIECLIKAHDLNQYQVLTRTHNNILETLNDICERQNRENRAFSVRAIIWGGYAFSHYLQGYLRSKGSPLEVFVFTGDIDVSISPNRHLDAEVHEIVPRIHGHDEMLKHRTTLPGTNPYVEDIVYNDGDDPNRRPFVKYGYELNRADAGHGNLVEGTNQHMLEIFVENEPWPRGPNQEPTPHGRPLANVYYMSLAALTNRCNGIAAMNVEPYKKKKYAARARILEFIRADAGVEPIAAELRQLYNFKECTDVAQGRWAAWVGGVDAALAMPPPLPPWVAPPAPVAAAPLGAAGMIGQPWVAPPAPVAPVAPPAGQVLPWGVAARAPIHPEIQANLDAAQAARVAQAAAALRAAGAGGPDREAREADFLALHGPGRRDNFLPDPAVARAAVGRFGPEAAAIDAADFARRVQYARELAYDRAEAAEDDLREAIEENRRNRDTPENRARWKAEAEWAAGAPARAQAALEKKRAEDNAAYLAELERDKAAAEAAARAQAASANAGTDLLRRLELAKRLFEGQSGPIGRAATAPEYIEAIRGASSHLQVPLREALKKAKEEWAYALDKGTRLGTNEGRTGEHSAAYVRAKKNLLAFFLQEEAALSDARAPSGKGNKHQEDEMVARMRFRDMEKQMPGLPPGELWNEEDAAKRYIEPGREPAIGAVLAPAVAAAPVAAPAAAWAPPPEVRPMPSWPAWIRDRPLVSPFMGWTEWHDWTAFEFDAFFKEWQRVMDLTGRDVPQAAAAAKAAGIAAKAGAPKPFTFVAPRAAAPAPASSRKGGGGIRSLPTRRAGRSSSKKRRHTYRRRA